MSCYLDAIDARSKAALRGEFDGMTLAELLATPEYQREIQAQQALQERLARLERLQRRLGHRGEHTYDSTCPLGCYRGGLDCTSAELRRG